MTTSSNLAFRHQKAFTLIEILVAMTVVAILVGLTIPAVQMSRESSRRAQCSNNLKQFGIAIHSYHQTFDCFPLAFSSPASLFVAILPQLEQAAVYNSLNIEASSRTNAPENRSILSLRISTFYCPSDPAFVSGTIGGINYCGNRGGGVQIYGYNGVFTFPGLPSVGFSSITDGSSGTALISEWLGSPNGPYEPVRSSQMGVFRTTTERLLASQFEPFVSQCDSLDPLKALIGAPPSKGSNWMFGEFGFTLYNHSLTPNRNSCTNGTAFQQGIWNTSSNHPGGVNLLFCDGHVQFIRDSIRLEAWRALGSRAGGEPVSADSL